MATRHCPAVHTSTHSLTAAQETLFILKRASWFGTAAGDVLQIIDLEAGRLQNVIEFPPDGAFVVDSLAANCGGARVSFKFTGATLRGRGWKYALPPRGTGWWAIVGPESPSPEWHFSRAISGVQVSPLAAMQV